MAINSHAISIATVNKMKISPILLGMRRQKASKASSTSLTEWDEDGWEDLHDLRKSSEIVIADDTNAYQPFGDSIFAAPQEDLLESACRRDLLRDIMAHCSTAFYASLGSRRMSTIVREDYKVSNEISDKKTASDVWTLVLERLPLFLHEHTHARTNVSLSWLSAAQLQGQGVWKAGRFQDARHWEWEDDAHAGRVGGCEACRYRTDRAVAFLYRAGGHV